MAFEGVKIGNGVGVKETERALLVKLDDEEDERWIPKSVIHDDSEVFEEGGEGTVVVAPWWAKKEGLG